MILAFYKGRKRLVNRLICLVTRGKYSHVELVLQELGNGLYLCLSSSMLDGGVRIKAIDLNSGNWDMVDIAGQVTYEQAMAWFYKHHTAKYDYTGALRYAIKWFKQARGKFYCSEAASDILRRPTSNHPQGLYDAITKAL